MSFLSWFVGEAGAAWTVAIVSCIVWLYRRFFSTSVKSKTNRHILLNKVLGYWVKPKLENDFYQKNPIHLTYNYQLNYVARPWSVSQPLSQDITDVFRQLGGSLLILGEAGAGKSTMLAEIAKHLIDKAKNPIAPIPLLFNLSTWSVKQNTLENWLIEELQFHYDIAHHYAVHLLETEYIHILLDGLDEVGLDLIDKCINSINGFIQKYGAKCTITITCRLDDYKRQKNLLNLKGSIEIEHLKAEQIQEYFTETNDIYSTARVAMNFDALLRDFATTPLHLSIITQIYRDEPLDSLITGTLNERRQNLFTTYVDNMLTFAQDTHDSVSKGNIIAQLSWLATKMKEHGQTVFQIEDLQPSWLGEAKSKERYKFFTGAILGSTIEIGQGGLFVGLLSGWIVGILLTLLRKLRLIKGFVNSNILFGVLGGILSMSLMYFVLGNWYTKQSLWIFSIIFGLIFNIGFTDFYSLLQDIGIDLITEVTNDIFINFNISVLFFSFLITSIIWSLNSDFDEKIKLLEKVNWSWKKIIRNQLLGLAFFSVIAIVLGWFFVAELFPSTIGSTQRLYATILYAFYILTGVWGFSLGPGLGIMWGIEPIEINTDSPINTGLRSSVENAFRFWLITICITGALFFLLTLFVQILFLLIIGLDFNTLSGILLLWLQSPALIHSINISVIVGLSAALYSGISWALVVALQTGGKSIIQHIILRSLIKKSISMELVEFLELMCTHNILYRVGRGYSFYHPMLQEYFINYPSLETNAQA